MTYIDYVKPILEDTSECSIFLERSLFVLLPFERVQ